MEQVVFSLEIEARMKTLSLLFRLEDLNERIKIRSTCKSITD
jgi:hypothetical protein